MKKIKNMRTLYWAFMMMFCATFGAYVADVQEVLSTGDIMHWVMGIIVSAIGVGATWGVVESLGDQMVNKENEAD